MRSEKAIPELLKIAIGPAAAGDNRPRWMAARALGLIGKPNVVPELVPLTYHYDWDTKFWAQISLVRLTGVNFADDVAAWSQWWESHGGRPPISERLVAGTTSGSVGTSKPAAAAASDQQAFVIGNSPYWPALEDMARRKGMTIGKSLNTGYDEYLPLANGQLLLVETHDGVPVVPLPVLDKFYPGASAGLKTPERIANVGNTKIVFLDFSALLNGVVFGSAGAVSLDGQAYVVGNGPYDPTLNDMVRKKGMTVAKSFGTMHGELLPLAKGHTLLIETHDGVPVVPLPVLEKVYPGASEGLKTPERSVTVEKTRIVFVDFSRLLNVPAIQANSLGK